MREVSFGQYYPSDSFLHKADARVKILATIAYVVAVFLVKQFHFLGFFCCFFVVLLSSLVAKVPFSRVLKSIKAVLFLAVFSAVLQIFFNKDGNVLLEWRFIKITDGGLLSAGFIVARIVLVVLGASLLTLTTTPVEIADGIESLMTPLKLVKVPVHEFALVMSIALRFIPTLLEETDRIIKAQKARGARFEGGLFKRAKALLPVLIPLLIGSFRRADELADAMDSRCYAGSKNRTKYKKMKLSYRDLVVVLCMSALVTGVILINGLTVFGGLL